MKITIAGLGYVGLSIAILASLKHEVIGIDIDPTKIDLINKRKSPFPDPEISYNLAVKPLNLKATLNLDSYMDSDLIFVAGPTDYNPDTNQFDTHSIESILMDIYTRNQYAIVCIKSTVPVGYTDSMRSRYPGLTIIFSPEFLREGHAIFDNVYPTRIIVGSESPIGRMIAEVLCEFAYEPVPVMLTNSREAEAIKLFSNAYLASRVAYFNELDSYTIHHNLDTKRVIAGVGLDPRIGTHYNNPSFGFGGYCLPKDTKQLSISYDGVPHDVIKSAIESNKTRKEFIAKTIIERKPSVVGIYRLVMKEGSGNFRNSAIIDIIQLIRNSRIECIIYEPLIQNVSIYDAIVVNNLEMFKENSDIILANRYSRDLDDVKDKVFTRDIS